MATFIKPIIISVFLLFSSVSIGHIIYAPNDIPLLDNRFRIDPKTEQVTFIFNHANGYQRVVLVKPDGSKLYQQRHPKSVAWVSSETQNIVTVQNPMAGPWQAIAELDGDNRIKLISDVQLTTNRLPLKLYAHEYITTHASLYYDGKLMDEPGYLTDAKLSVSLLGEENKKMSLYKDDGKHYDELPFDGKLTARLYVDLAPGRYLLHIRTKNDVFIRNVNKDAVVFSSPVNYEITPLTEGSDEAKLTFSIDSDEIDPKSVSINGVIKDVEDEVVERVIMHSMDSSLETEAFQASYKLSHRLYTFSGKAYATTHDGREIELQLPDTVFELIPTFTAPVIEISEAVPTQEIVNETEDLSEVEETESEATSNNLWLIIAIVVVLILLSLGALLFILKRKKKSQQESDEVDGELNLDELQPMPIDIKEGK